MITRFQLACLMLTLGLLAATAASAEDAVPLRSFSRFELDSGTVDGLWTEVGTAYSEDRESGVSTDLATVFGRLAYGGKYAEAGLLFPYHNLDVDLGRSGSANEDGIGDSPPSRNGCRPESQRGARRALVEPPVNSRIQSRFAWLQQLVTINPMNTRIAPSGGSTALKI